MAVWNKMKLKDRFVGDKAKPSNKRCVVCKNLMTHAAVMVQYGRMRREGLTQEEASGLLPRCQKCTTRLVKARRVIP